METMNDYFRSVRMLATMFAVNGNPDERARLVDILELPIDDKSKRDMLCYELGVIADFMDERDPLRGRCRKLSAR